MDEKWDFLFVDCNLGVVRGLACLFASGAERPD
jgi:hypothetical protein